MSHLFDSHLSELLADIDPGRRIFAMAEAQRSKSQLQQAPYLVPRPITSTETFGAQRFSRGRYLPQAPMRVEPRLYNRNIGALIEQLQSARARQIGFKEQRRLEQNEELLADLKAERRVQKSLVLRTQYREEVAARYRAKEEAAVLKEQERLQRIADVVALNHQHEQIFRPATKPLRRVVEETDPNPALKKTLELIPLPPAQRLRSPAQRMRPQTPPRGPESPAKPAKRPMTPEQLVKVVEQLPKSRFESHAVKETPKAPSPPPPLIPEIKPKKTPSLVVDLEERYPSRQKVLPSPEIKNDEKFEAPEDIKLKTSDLNIPPSLLLSVHPLADAEATAQQPDNNSQVIASGIDQPKKVKPLRKLASERAEQQDAPEKTEGEAPAKKKVRVKKRTAETAAKPAEDFDDL